LAGAFVAVAIVSLGSFALLVLLADNRGIADLALTQRGQVSSALDAAAVASYRAASGWQGADLRPLTALAALSGATVVVRAGDGAVVLEQGDRSLLNATGATERWTLSADGRVVGNLELAFPPGGLTPADRRLRAALLDAASIGAGLAVAVAVATSVVSTQMLVRPLRRLSRAIRAVGSGDRDVRVGAEAGPGELAEVGAGFDAMVAALGKAERLREAMVADVAHELRTPIAVLQGETEALVDGVVQPTPAALASLHDETLRLSRMVEDLQTVASADAAGLRLECEPVDLAVVARGAAGALERSFAAAEVKLRYRTTSAVVRGDPRWLYEIVTNLLVNACKFTPAGGAVLLDVRSTRGLARLEVSDNGPGVPADEREHIFERFYRGRSGRRAGGSGIGLWVVKGLVEAHGGRVHVEDLPDGGSRFVVVLALASQTSAIRGEVRARVGRRLPNADSRSSGGEGG
jgi:signal transduction histidine kinase